jgi:hypothetical protein
MLDKKEYGDMIKELCTKWVTRIAPVLEGKTITKVSAIEVPSGVDGDDIIQDYMQLDMSDGSHVRIGVDYEEIDFLMCEVDDSGTIIPGSIVYRSEYFPEL